MDRGGGTTTTTTTNPDDETRGLKKRFAILSLSRGRGGALGKNEKIPDDGYIFSRGRSFGRGGWGAMTAITRAKKGRVGSRGEGRVKERRKRKREKEIFLSLFPPPFSYSPTLFRLSVRRIPYSILGLFFFRTSKKKEAEKKRAWRVWRRMRRRGGGLMAIYI